MLSCVWVLSLPAIPVGPCLSRRVSVGGGARALSLWPVPLSGCQAAFTRSLVDGPLTWCQFVAVLNNAAGNSLVQIVVWTIPLVEGVLRVTQRSWPRRGHPGFPPVLSSSSCVVCVFHSGLISVEGVRSGNKVCVRVALGCACPVVPAGGERPVCPTASLFLSQTRGRVYGGPFWLSVLFRRPFLYPLAEPAVWSLQPYGKS